MSYAAKLDEGGVIRKPATRRTHYFLYSAVRRYSTKRVGFWSSTVQRKQLNNSQKNYLTKMFDLGEKTGHKVKANAAAQSMRKARNPDCSSMFDSSEYLTPKQIKSFFSRLAKKRKEAKADSSEDEMEQDEEARLNERRLEELTVNVMNEIGLIYPIMFESYNLCELAACSKLSKFSISMLQEIYVYYEHDTSSIKRNKKTAIC